MSGRIPLAVPDLRGREAEYLSRCVADNWVSSAGPFVREMEARMAVLSGRAYAVAVVNGTAALHLALHALGVGPGDLVAVPDWTFAATANAVCHAGAQPLFVDIEPGSWTMCPVALRAAFSRHGTRLRAAIAVDVLGTVADFGALGDACAAADAALIEDAAGSIGAARDGRPAGAFGHAGTFSFNGNKTVTAGGGGMLVTDDEKLARRSRHLSTQARPSDDYVHDEVGFNYRMTNVNAAIGMAQLERLGEMLEAKRQIARRYADALAGRRDAAPQPLPAGCETSAWLSAVRVAREADAHALVDAMRAAGAEARIFWRSLSTQPAYNAFPRDPAPRAAALSGCVVTLPCSSHLTAAEQERVVTVLAKWKGNPISAPELETA